MDHLARAGWMTSSSSVRCSCGHLQLKCRSCWLMYQEEACLSCLPRMLAVANLSPGSTVHLQVACLSILFCDAIQFFVYHISIGVYIHSLLGDAVDPSGCRGRPQQTRNQLYAHWSVCAFSSRAWLCCVEAKELRVCMGATGSIGGAYIISSPRVPGYARFNFFVSTALVL